jgi:hypothetical protein
MVQRISAIPEINKTKDQQSPMLSTEVNVLQKLWCMRWYHRNYFLESSYDAERPGSSMEWLFLDSWQLVKMSKCMHTAIKLGLEGTRQQRQDRTGLDAGDDTTLYFV